MNNQNELLKRIDTAIANMAINSGLLHDCRAEIERLEAETDLLTPALEATVLVRNNQSRQIDELKNEIERLSKPYVPMTDDELHDLWFLTDGLKVTETLRYAEAKFIKRYNEQRGVK